MLKILMIAFVALLVLQGCAKDVIPDTSSINSTMPGTIAADAQ